MNITFIWDDGFNSANAVTKYFLSVNSSSLFGGDGSNDITCPLSCSVDEVCTCTGQLGRDGVNVNISAVNCDDQEGPPRTVTVKSMREIRSQ